MGRSITILIAVTLVVLLATPASSIVIRHDKDDKLYRELGEKYPAAVSILPDGTGVLIASDWVLTAAHVARGVSRRDPRVEANGKEYGVARVYIHPEWTRGPQDIALMKLKTPVKGIEPVELYSGDDEVGMEVVFVGKGDFGTGLTGPTEMDRVKRGATNVVDHADDDWVMFTFEEPGKGTELEGVSGPGDSGGPALIEREGKLYTIGVSVFADGDGGPGRYGVKEGYTRVSTHRDWILEVLDGKHEGTALTPGEGKTTRRVRATPGEGAGQAMSVSIGPLPDSAVGKLVETYIDAYNSDDWDRMRAFMEAHFTKEYFEDASLEERKDRYRRIRDEHLGSIEMRGVVGEDDSGIRVLFDSERGQMAEFRFETTSTDPPKIDGLRVALVQMGMD